MRLIRMTRWMGSPVLLLSVLAASAGGQERAQPRAPLVHIYLQNGATVASRYVEPAIEVGEEAYIFAVSMDVDGKIQVLHPELPGISVRIHARREMRLPNFFVGFAQYDYQQGMYSNYDYANYDYANYDRGGYADNDTRGTVIALASREPFDLGLIASGGDWNIAAIRRLIEQTSPASAAQNLAQYLGAKGEPIGRDYVRFAGRRQPYYGYAADALSPCDLYYGFSYGGPLQAFSRLQGINRAFALHRRGRQPVLLGYDICGMPIISFGPSSRPRAPILRFPPRPGDPNIFPRSRVPHGVAHAPIERGGQPGEAAIGAFPQSRHAEPYQLRGGAVTAPRARGGDSHTVLLPPNAQPGTPSMPPSTRMPRGADQPARAQPAAIGTQELQGFRPEPRVNAPPPTRAAQPRPHVVEASTPRPAPVAHERPVERAAPVVHERPVERAAPPPRAESPAPSSRAPVSSPPPRH